MDYSKVRDKWWWGVIYHREQLDWLISCVDIRQYAYILHDKDIDPETEKLKDPHYHCIVNLYSRQRGSWFKRFWTDDKGRIFFEPVGSPEHVFIYLTHTDEKSIKAGKHVYSELEIVNTITDFSSDEKKDKDSSEFVLCDILSIIDGQMSWREFYKKFPSRIQTSGQTYRAYRSLLSESLFDMDKYKLDDWSEKRIDLQKNRKMSQGSYLKSARKNAAKLALKDDDELF